MDYLLPPRASPPSKGLEESPVWRWLAGGNTVVRIGVVILFFGVAFLLKYAQEYVRVPIELRLAGVAAGAITLLAVGWRLRERRLGYALALQGGGTGLLYRQWLAAGFVRLLPDVVRIREPAPDFFVAEITRPWTTAPCGASWPCAA